MDLAARWKALPPGTVDTRVGRVSAGVAAVALGTLGVAGPPFWLGIAAGALLVDYGGRAFTRGLGSPLTWIAGVVLDAARVPPQPTELAPMRWSVAVGAVWFAAVLALAEGGFELPARVVALAAVPVLGAFAFAGFCTVGTIYRYVAARLLE